MRFFKSTRGGHKYFTSEKAKDSSMRGLQHSDLRNEQPESLSGLLQSSAREPLPEDQKQMNRFTQITFTAFFVIGVPLIYAIWLRLFWLNIMWGVDFTMLMFAIALWAIEDSLHYDFTQEE